MTRPHIAVLGLAAALAFGAGMPVAPLDDGGYPTEPNRKRRRWTETNRNKDRPHFTSERPMTKRQKRRARGKAKP